MGVTTVMCALCRLFELVWLAISHPLFAIVGCGELTYGVLRFIVCMPILGFMMLFDPVYADQAHCLINSHREQVQQFGIDVTNFQAAITEQWAALRYTVLPPSEPTSTPSPVATPHETSQAAKISNWERLQQLSNDLSRLGDLLELLDCHLGDAASTSSTPAFIAPVEAESVTALPYDRDHRDNTLTDTADFICLLGSPYPWIDTRGAPNHYESDEVSDEESDEVSDEESVEETSEEASEILKTPFNVDELAVPRAATRLTQRRLNTIMGVDEDGLKKGRWLDQQGARRQERWR